MGIHLLLEEIGKPYETRKLSFADHEQYKPEFAAINPKGKVPTLVRDDGSVLTEYGAIATWLARSNPASRLLPDDIEGEVRVRELLDYCVGTVQYAFTRMFVPAVFTANAADHAAVRARGRELVEQKYFPVLERTLTGGPYAVGSSFSIADSALFYLGLWSRHHEIALPPNFRAHFERLMARPAASKVLRDEGLAKA
jgi:glutathione S-transferase